MKLVFAGTPAVALPTLDILAAHHEIVSVITREDAPQGRKRVLTPSPVASRASELGIPTIRANRLDDLVTKQVAEDFSAKVDPALVAANRARKDSQRQMATTAKDEGGSAVEERLGKATGQEFDVEWQRLLGGQ